MYSILGFIFAISLLAAIHELGHFSVARLLGVKVLRFSVGFGKTLLSKFDKFGTEYIFAAIPLGGYVKMQEGKDSPVSFDNKPVWARMLIIAAGPAFNLIFAVLAYWAVFMLGIATVVPVIGNPVPSSIADNAGLKSGQEIVAINNNNINSWEDVAVNLISHSDTKKPITIQTKDLATKQIIDYQLDLSVLAPDQDTDNLLKDLGLQPLDPIKPIVDVVLPDTPAQAAGLLPGDQVMQIDNVVVDNRSAVMQLLQASYDKPVLLTIKRDNNLLNITITPNKGLIGIQFAEQTLPADMIRMQSYTAWPALQHAFIKTSNYVKLTLQFLGKMVMGQMSLDHVAGPISIAKFAGHTAESGLAYFISFLALISISLGVLNMLPIPVLDGGHFLFCLIELVRGKPMSAAAINFGQRIGFAFLGTLMVLAVYNDLVRIFHPS